MLAVGLGLADITRPAQAEAPHSLRDRALHPGPHRAQGGELGRCPSPPCPHKRGVVLMRAQRQAATRPFATRSPPGWHAPQSEPANLILMTSVSVPPAFWISRTSRAVVSFRVRIST